MTTHVVVTVYDSTGFDGDTVYDSMVVVIVYDSTGGCDSI